MQLIGTNELDFSAYAICVCCGREIYIGELAHTYFDSVALVNYIFCSTDCFMDFISEDIELTRETAKKYSIELHSSKEKIKQLRSEIPKLEAELLIKKGELDFLTNNTKLML